MRAVPESKMTPPALPVGRSMRGKSRAALSSRRGRAVPPSSLRSPRRPPWGRDSLPPPLAAPLSSLFVSERGLRKLFSVGWPHRGQCRRASCGLRPVRWAIVCDCPRPVHQPPHEGLWAAGESSRRAGAQT